MKAIHPIIEDIVYWLRYPIIKMGMIMSAIAVIVAVVVGAGYWWPAYSETQNLAGAIEAKRQQIIEEARAAQIYGAYFNAAKQVVIFEKKINSHIGQADLVSNIDRLAIKQNLRIISEAYDEGKEKNGHMPLYLDLTLQGDYQSLRGFFLDIHTLPTWSFIEEASISRLQGQENLIKAQLRLITYHKVDKVGLTESPP